MIACFSFFLFIVFFFFFFNDTATTEIYTLSLHDALPICAQQVDLLLGHLVRHRAGDRRTSRSEEHTSELQSQFHLVCRLLLEKKKKKIKNQKIYTISHRKQQCKNHIQSTQGTTGRVVSST